MAAIRARGLFGRTSLALFLTAIAGFVLYTAIRALWSAFSNDDFPESLAVKLDLLPRLFPLHMIAGGLALLLVPLAYALRHHRRAHRFAGGIAATAVFVAGATAFPVAWAAPVTIGSAAGFTAQAIVWLVLLALGIGAMLQRQFTAHRTRMILMAATMSGAVFFRIFLALWAILASGRHFELFYAGDAWAAWLLPLTTCSLWLFRQGRSQRAGKFYPAKQVRARKARASAPISAAWP